MAKRKQFWTLLAMGVLLIAGFGVLAGRLVYLQVIRHQDLSLRAAKNTHWELYFEPRRGDILDGRGNLLATSVFVKTVYANPSLMGSRTTEVARAVAPLLQMSESELLAKFAPRRNKKGELVIMRYVPLKKKVMPDVWHQIKTTMNGLSFGIDEKKLPVTEQAFYRDLREAAIAADPVDDQLRMYPNSNLAAHVLGYVGARQATLNGRPITETTGKDGIERTLESRLAGVRGWRITEKTRNSRELVAFRDQDIEQQDGDNVVLTIDSVIQNIVESELAIAMEKHKPISVSSIVMRPRTGEILAMATLPNFDPNNLADSTADERRNRVITDTAEPGSTFKIVTVSGALNEHVVNPTEVFDCENGYFHYANRVLTDHGHYQLLTVEGIITKSSNIGAAKIGIKLGENRLYDYMRAYGFGSPTEIALPGEVRGTVHPVREWTKVSIAQIPMGHYVTVTPLQMIMAMGAIANGGVLMRPMLVARLEDREHNVLATYYPQKVRRVISEETARKMVAALKTVPTPDGTAEKAAMEHYTVAGKTGTAWKVENKAYVRKYFSSFIGFFPADNPELCISVVMDEPKRETGYYGGIAAAPVFRQIAERVARYLSIPPDKIDEDSSSEKVAAVADTTRAKGVMRTP